MVLSEGTMEKKSPVTPPGIDPGTVRLVVLTTTLPQAPKGYEYFDIIIALVSDCGPPPPHPSTNLAVHAVTQTALSSSSSLIKGGRGGGRLTKFGAGNKHLTRIPVELGEIRAGAVL